jgi:hypothetical protein
MCSLQVLKFHYTENLEFYLCIRNISSTEAYIWHECAVCKCYSFITYRMWNYTRAVWKVRGKPYYSESGLCGRAVTVSFSKYLPWQAMHFLQRSTHFSKICCKLQEDSGTSGFDLSRSFLCLWSASTNWKPQVILLHRLHRLDVWVVGFQNSIVQS